MLKVGANRGRPVSISRTFFESPIGLKTFCSKSPLIQDCPVPGGVFRVTGDEQDGMLGHDPKDIGFKIVATISTSAAFLPRAAISAIREKR